MRKFKRNRTAALILGIAVLLIPAVATAQSQSATLAYETEGLDLEAGTVITLEDGAGLPDSDADVKFAYNSLRVPHAVIFHAVGAEIALMSSVVFDYVSESDIDTLTFSFDLVDVSCGNGDTAVLRTLGGSVYKIGNLQEDPTEQGSVTFDYELLQSPQAALPTTVQGAALLAAVSGPQEPATSRADRASGVGALASLPAEELSAMREAIQAVIEADRYSFGRGDTGNTLTAANAAQGYSSSIDPAGVRVHAGGAELGLRLVGYGYEGRLEAVPAAAPEATGQRAEIVRGPLTEWFVNRPAGLEHGFTVETPPRDRLDGASLEFDLAVSGMRVSEATPDSIGLRDDETGTQLRYAGLVAWDANGQTLPSRMAGSGEMVRLLVDDTSAVYPVTVDPSINYDADLLPTDLTSFQWGERPTVCNGGDTMIAGDYDDDTQGTNAGAAWVFEKPAGGWSGTVTESVKLLPTGGNIKDRFGWDTSCEDDTVVVGALDWDATGPLNGAVFVFEKPLGGWGSVASPIFESVRLESSTVTAFARMGMMPSISGDTVVAGSLRGAFVFEKPLGGWASVPSPLFESATLAPAITPCAGVQFGRCTAFDGETVVAGDRASCAGDDANGRVYVFEKPPGGWASVPSPIAESVQLRPSDLAFNDAYGCAQSFFRSTAISGDTVVVGSLRHDENCPPAIPDCNSGAAYIYEKPPGGWASLGSPLSEVAEVAKSGANGTDLLGVWVDIEDDVVATNGTPGAYVFKRPPGGWTGVVTEECYLKSSSSQVALSEGVMVTGLGFNIPGVGVPVYVLGADCGVGPTCVDNDSDGYGSPGDASCSAGAATDCDDGDFNINPGAAEVCDLIDNDCSGTADDGIAPVPTTCGVGECAGNTGSQTCVAGALVDSCDPFAGASTELCDLLDNDCNGAADDGIAPIPTTCGVGQCSGNAGALTCVVGSLVDSCDPFAGAGAEVCDAIDNNCDGSTDEGTPDGDTDGVCDDIDNCEFDANPGQENCDGDTTGDVCDPDDDDGDGLTDAMEINFAGGVCPGGCPDPTLGDSDGDGLLDGFESNPDPDLNCDFCLDDTDGDGTLDASDPFCNDATLTGDCAQDLDDFEAYILSLPTSVFQAPGANTEQQKQQTRAHLASIIGKAAKHLDKCKTANAINELQKARDRVDGAEPPLDDMVAGTAEKAIVLDTIDDFLFLLSMGLCGC